MHHRPQPQPEKDHPLHTLVEHSIERIAAAVAPAIL